MSIGYKKLSELIDLEIEELEDLTSKQKESLAELCKKLYMMESNDEFVSTQRLIDNMMGEIGNAADKFNDDGKGA